MEQRLQKLLSACGFASRRTVEAWIAAGRVRVNGAVAQVGDKADPDRDEITVDGAPLQAGGERRYLMLNKPRGFVTTLADERGRKTVADLVSDCGARVWPVGRLDLDSEGLLLLTDDGELTQRLLHPKYEIEKEYIVWVTGDTKRGIPILTQPMELDGETLAPAVLKRGRVSGGVSQLSVTIRQGKKRQVRRMCAAAGLTVQRLKRVREGNLWLDRTLAPGAWRDLTPEEIQILKNGK